MKFKEVPLYPTHFRAHIFLISRKEHDKMHEVFKRLYGLKIDEYSNWADTTNRFESGCDCVFPNEKIIAVCLDKDAPVSHTVHEAKHVLDFLSKWTGLEQGYEATEWNAYFIEYVFREITDPKGYKYVSKIK